MQALESQLIGQKVTVGGHDDISMDFSGDLNYQIPATLNLQQ
jgi:hypothetical protein